MERERSRNGKIQTEETAMAAKIGVLIGSLRRESYTRKIAKALISLAPQSLAFEEIAIGDLAMYNQDLDDDGTPPAEWTAFRERVKGFDALLLLTPEYNRSVPPVLKNALDVGSRPMGKSVWNGKPGAVVSVSPGAIGGFGASQHLRQTLASLNIPVMPQPEAYIGNVAALLDLSGGVANEKTIAFLRVFMEAFAKWAETNRAK
jgi:chromate reductase, NAD(P)H dehydrogenase (quinone)